jgi:hypothetical protein
MIKAAIGPVKAIAMLGHKNLANHRQVPEFAFSFSYGTMKKNGTTS